MKKIEVLLFDRLTPSLFRLLLAVLVMIYHTVDFISLGHYAVYVFLMLSGYWIFRMYAEKYVSYQQSYLTYISSRLVRLMPMYWLILLISVMVYLLIPTLFARIENVADPVNTGITNFLILGSANTDLVFIGTVWSLDVEIQFYLIAPLLVLLFRKGWSVILFIVFSLLSLGLIYWHYESINLLIYLPYFLIGGMIYVFQYKASKQLALICLGALVGCLAILYGIPELRTTYLLGRDTDVLGFNSREALNAIWALLTVPFVSINVRQESKKNTAGREQLWSSMSYVIYLLHWPLLQIYAFFTQNAGSVKKLIYLLIYYTVCLIGAYLFSKYVDVFWESKRRKWLGSRKKKEQPVHSIA